MPTGTCLCGEIKVEFSDPIAKVLCHCLTCKKQMSTLFSTNYVVPGSKFTILTGTPKKWIKRHSDGSDSFTTVWCNTCGTTLWSESAPIGDAKVIKAGIADVPEDFETLVKPDAEIFTRSRETWLMPVEGATQFEGQMPLSDSGLPAEKLGA